MSYSTLPAPLVPAEVDLRDFQYMELDVRRLRDSRFGAEVSGDAFRAGVMLWCASWHQVPCGSVPDDDIELANLAGFGRFFKEWRKVRDQALQGFVKCSDGRLYHETVCEKAAAAWLSKLAHHYSRACDRLRKKNKARAAEQLAPLPELTFDQWNAERVAAGIPMEKAEASAGIPQTAPPPKQGIPAENALKGNGEGTERRGNGEGTEIKEKEPGEVVAAAPPDSGAPPPPAPPPPPAADAAPKPVAERGARLPKDWELPKAWGDWALGKYPQWTAEKVRLEGSKFRNHWVAKTGKDATKLDWRGTWENWCHSPIAHQDDPKPGARGGPLMPIDTTAKNAEAKRLVFGIPDTPIHQEVLPHA